MTIALTNIYLSVNFQPYSFNPSKCSTFLLCIFERVETCDEISLNSTQTLADISLQMIFLQPLWSSAVEQMTRLHTDASYSVTSHLSNLTRHLKFTMSFISVCRKSGPDVNEMSKKLTHPPGS